MINSRSASSAPAGYRFPREVIAVAVRWYLRYGLSYRDVEELLAEHGSRSTTSRSIAGCRPSPPSSSTPRARRDTRRAIAGSRMRPTSGSPAVKPICTARWISTVK
ncbi:MAG: transposase, family [Pseudonocardiales bacterium]|nr:transposase, family [Pseudonocardiales bacterium]